MKFIQVLEEVTGIEQSKIDKYVEDFRKSIGFTPEELESLKNEDIDKIVLCENQKVSIEKKLASTILLVLMICATAAFVWFTFLV